MPRSLVRRRRSRLRGLLPAALVLFGGRALASDAATKGLAEEPLYARFCLPCHGEQGDGRGPAAPLLWPRPRDLRGVMKWVGPAGDPGRRARVERLIRQGVPGTAMPAFGATLSGAQIERLGAVVEAFAGVDAALGPVEREPARSGAVAGRAAAGREAYRRLGCATCHGGEGRGDGEAAAGLRHDDGTPARPFDLRAHPPRGGRRPEDVARAIEQGVPGTPMPAYGASTTAEERDDLAALILSFSAAPSVAPSVAPSAAPASARRAEPTAVPAPALAAPLDVRPAFAFPAPAQGAPPPGMAPAVASLAPAQCGRCHAKQLREWTGSLHARAMSPGLRAQSPSLSEVARRDCARCHAPLAEQRPGGAAYDADLERTAVNCAGCHVRGHTRHGPSARAPSLLAAVAYPVAESPVHERADFCMPCHQHGPRDGVVNGKPLLNTYREWLEGPYFRQGFVCQHCHMPNREHTWRGAHDSETVKQGLRAELEHAPSAGGVLRAVLRVTNVGAAHNLPTTPTPALFLKVWLSDERGRRLPGTLQEERIGRDIAFRDGRWQELADTRLPPGASRQLEWSAAPTRDAAFLRAEVEMRPDAYYEGFYEAHLKDRAQPKTVRLLYESALNRARRNVFVVWEKAVRLGP